MPISANALSASASGSRIFSMSSLAVCLDINGISSGLFLEVAANDIIISASISLGILGETLTETYQLGSISLGLTLTVKKCSLWSYPLIVDLVPFSLN